MKRALLGIMAIVGGLLIFGAVGHLDYMDLTKQASQVKDIVAPLVLGVMLIFPGLLEAWRASE